MFHLGAQAHVGESWHRPYETVMANTVGTLNLLQSIVDHDLELEKFDTAGTSEEYGNVRESVAHHHDFDEGGGLILHERSPINPKSIYATSKVAADFLTMNYHDAYGVPARRDADVQQLRPAPEPALRHRHDHHPGARAAPRSSSGSSSRCATSASAPTASAAISPSRRAASPATSTSTARARTSRWPTGSRLILRVGEEGGFWPAGREVVTTRRATAPARAR